MVWVGILLSVFQQFVGINVIFYYSTTLWQAVGFDESDSFMVSTITSVTNVVVTFIAIALIDKVGRRPLLLTGSVGMAVTLGIMSLAFTQSRGPTRRTPARASPSSPSRWGVIALIAANLFVVFFGATWGPLVWVLLGEMFPNRIRAAALGVAAAAQWIANFVITITFPPLLDTFGASIPYLMYAIFAALSFLFMLWKVPETKGIELEDMEGVKVDRARRGTATDRLIRHHERGRARRRPAALVRPGIVRTPRLLEASIRSYGCVEQQKGVPCQHQPQPETPTQALLRSVEAFSRTLRESSLRPRPGHRLLASGTLADRPHPRAARHRSRSATSPTCCASTSRWPAAR